MLRDITLRPAPRGLREVLDMLGVGGPHERLGKGLYLSSHWSMPLEVDGTVEEYAELSDQDFCPYGVCDTPAQLLEKFPEIATSPRPFFVSFVRIRRDEQPAVGGWRWHKWGPYIGTQDPQSEHIHDEPVIEEVFTYHVYEIVDPFALPG